MAKARTGVVEEAAAIGAQREPLPPLPAKCAAGVRSGVTPDDRADVALAKQDDALTRANRLFSACAALYERVRGARSGE